MAFGGEYTYGQRVWKPIFVLQTAPRSPVPIIEGRNQWPMVGSHAPIGKSENASSFGLPLAFHPAAQEDVVNTTVSILHVVIMGPGNSATGMTAARCAWRVSVLFGRPRVHQAHPTASAQD